MSQSFSAFVMCFCLLSVNLIILLSCYFLVFGSALVVLLPYSWFGRQVWVFNYFSLTSWNFMASPRLHHFRIALLLPMIYFFFILRLCVFQFIFFFFWILWWRLILDALNAPACHSHYLRHGLRVDCRLNLYLACVHAPPYGSHLVNATCQCCSLEDALSFRHDKG